MAFSILNYLDKLEPTKEKHAYICPVCGGDRLTVEPKTGKYSCWHGCECRDIREAIAPFSGLTPDYLDRLQARAKKRKEEAQRVQAEKEQQTLGLDDFLTERSAEFERRFGSAGLSEQHRRDLQRRGLSEEAIASGGFCSVPFGLVCPTWMDEKIIGYQIRSDRADNGDKYKWGKHQRLNNGEMPITVVGAPVDAIANLSEGILKPFISQQRHGGLWVGAAGGHFRASELTLMRSLSALGIKKIIYWPDSDGTKFNIHARKAELLQWLESKGFEVAIAYWGQLDGSKFDCDELSADTTIKKISLSQYWAKIGIAQRVRSLTRKPDIILNSKRLLPDVPKQLPRFGLLGVKSAKKTGKTRSIIKQLIEECKANSLTILSLFPRISLGLQSCAEWGIPWKADLDLVTEDGQDFSKMQRAHTNEIGLCFDSLLAVSWREWDVLILDELHTLLEHLLTANTAIANNRPQIIAAFEKLCRNAKLILCLDADLDDTDIQYMEAIAGRKMFLVRNDGKPEEGNPLLFYEGKPGSIHDRILSAASAGQRVIFFSDSRTEIEAIESILVEHGIKCQSWTQDTARLPEVKEQMKDPNRWLSTDPPQVLLISPTAIVGLSIEIDCFDLRIGYSVGVCQPYAFRQLIARYRPNIATEIYAKKCGMPTGELSHYTDPKKVIKALTLNAKDGFNIAALAQAIAIKEDGFDPEDWVEILQEWQSDDWASCPSLQLYAEIVARRNFAWKHHAELLKAELGEEGFQVIEAIGEDSYASELVKEAKQEIKQKEAAQRFEGWNGSLTLDDARIILDDPSASAADRNQAKGVLLREDLPGFSVTAEWILANVIQNPLYLNRLRLGYFMQHRPLATILDGIKTRSHLKQWKNGIIFVPDLTTVSAKLRMLEAIGIEQIINSPGFATTLDDPLIAEFWEKCWFRRYQMSRILGVPISENSKPGKILSSILQKIGLKLEGHLEGKSRQRIYRVVAPPERDDIFQAWDLKYSDLVAASESCADRIPEIATALSEVVQPAQIAESQTEQDSKGVSRSPDKNVSLINTPTSAHQETEEKSDLSSPAPTCQIGERVTATYIDGFGVTCIGEGEITNVLADSAVVKVGRVCYSVAFEDLHPIAESANNRIDLDGWREILQMVAAVPDADAQLLAEATAGMPPEWRQKVWQRLSSQVRDRLQQIRSVVQPIADGIASFSVDWMWSG